MTDSLSISPDNQDIPGHVVDENIAYEVDRVINNENVLKYIADTVQRTVIGNSLAIELLILICAQRGLFNGHGVYTQLNGDSGGGKSHVTRQVLWHMPPEFVEDSSMSPKAIFYNNTQEPKIYYIDDINALNEDIKSTLKNVLTNFRRVTQHKAVNKGELKTYNVPARTVIIFSSVDSIADQQVMNRIVPLPVDTDPATKEEIHNYQIKVAAGLLEDYDSMIDDRIVVCREIIRRLTSKPQWVDIPFATSIEWPKHELNSRNEYVFHDLIRLSAILEQRKRTVVNGRISANYEDFYTAVRIYAPRRAMQATKLSNGPQTLLNYLVKNKDKNFTQAELVKNLGVSQASISRHIKILQEMSYVVEDSGTRTPDINEKVYVKVYSYNGAEIKSTVFDYPIQLSAEERAKPEYIKFMEGKI